MCLRLFRIADIYCILLVTAPLFFLNTVLVIKTFISHVILDRFLGFLHRTSTNLDELDTILSNINQSIASKTELESQWSHQRKYKTFLESLLLMKVSYSAVAFLTRVRYISEEYFDVYQFVSQSLIYLFSFSFCTNQILSCVDFFSFSIWYAYRFNLWSGIFSSLMACSTCTGFTSFF